MSIKIGEKIKSLRKQKNISQEILANYLGISFQAVSKWENETAIPDVTLIPAIASFFGVSTDELFDFNLLEINKNVDNICTEAYRFRSSNPKMSEKILRNGLKKYPGNDILLNNLLYTMRSPERSDEVINLCKALIESTKYDDVKYDALRILAETYKSAGEYALAKTSIERIPEIYFTKLQLDALLLDGEDMYESAVKQKYISAEMLVEMLLRLADYYSQKSDNKKSKIQLLIAKKIIEAFKDDFTTKYTKQFYENSSDTLENINKQIL